MALRTVKPYARLTARRGAGFYICWVSRGPVAQGIEQQPSKLKVAGSNPAGVASRISICKAVRGVRLRRCYAHFFAARRITPIGMSHLQSTERRCGLQTYGAG